MRWGLDRPEGQTCSGSQIYTTRTKKLYQGQPWHKLAPINFLAWAVIKYAMLIYKFTNRKPLINELSRLVQHRRKWNTASQLFAGTVASSSIRFAHAIVHVRRRKLSAPTLFIIFTWKRRNNASIADALYTRCINRQTMHRLPHSGRRRSAPCASNTTPTAIGCTKWRPQCLTTAMRALRALGASGVVQPN